VEQSLNMSALSVQITFISETVRDIKADLDDLRKSSAESSTLQAELQFQISTLAERIHKTENKLEEGIKSNRTFDKKMMIALLGVILGGSGLGWGALRTVGQEPIERQQVPHQFHENTRPCVNVGSFRDCRSNSPLSEVDGK